MRSGGTVTETREQSIMSGLLARRTHTLYAPGTVAECRELLDAGTADDPARRLNANAFRVDWANDEEVTVRTGGGVPGRQARVRLMRHDWGTSAHVTTRAELLPVAIAWLGFVGLAAIGVAMAVNRGDGESVLGALFPVGYLALAPLVVLLWTYARTGATDAAIVHGLATAIGAKSVDGVSSPQYALRPNWPPPSEASLRARESASPSA
jgi:hypothetical protein